MRAGPLPGGAAGEGRVRLELVARSTPDIEGETLDLAPYRMSSTETLIGVRSEWMNHGFGITRLTLLRRVEGRLEPVLEVAVASSEPLGGKIAEAVECDGIIAMEPRTDAPADIVVRWKVEASMEKTGKFRSVDRPDEVARYRWTGSVYVLDGEPGSCARRAGGW